ncbi:hypothetical protein RF11_00054 [Thelohanellus kitauei]|uniref:Uncharacterized protein n=1 Tax=Thelohanellus kitauei TaxID=669202 RepID=A0A0C2JX72_THEKT|nr:hypothetical protein RF11_00054 [Thelohanellus kitauei]
MSISQFRIRAESKIGTSYINNVPNRLLCDPVPFPTFPTSLLTSYNDTRTIPEIISYLHESERLRTSLRQEMLQLTESISKEINRLEAENSVYREKDSFSKNKYEDMERDLAQIKQSYKVAKTKILNYEENQKKHIAEINRLKNENDILSQKFSNERSARHILKRKLKDLQDHQVYQLERECNKRVNEATEDIKNQLRRQDRRLKVVKGVLENTTNLPTITDPSTPNSRCTDDKETQIVILSKK